MSSRRRLTLSEEQIRELEEFIQNPPSGRIGLRASMVLDCGTGMTGAKVAAKYGERPSTVSLWKNRYCEFGIRGLLNLSRGRTKDVYGPDFQERLQAALRSAPPDGCPAWDVARLSQYLEVPKYGIRRYLQKLGIQLETQSSSGSHRKEGVSTASAADADSYTGEENRPVEEVQESAECVGRDTREDHADGMNVSLTVTVTSGSGEKIMVRTVDLGGILADLDHFDLSTVAGFHRDYGRLEQGMIRGFGDLLEQFSEDYTAMVRKKQQ